MSKLLALRIKDLMMLEDVSIACDSKLNIFAGRNNQGKTSVLTAINLLMEGSTDTTFIRNGADKAELEGDFINPELGTIDLKVFRTLKRKGTNTLKVKVPVRLPNTTEDTFIDVPTSPQEYLHGTVSDFSFNPIKFFLLGDKERTKYLRELFKTKVTPEMLKFVPAEFLTGINYDQDGIDICNSLSNDKNGRIYITRRDVNKDLTQAKALSEAAHAKVTGYDPESFKGDQTEDISKRLRTAEDSLTKAQTIKKQAEGTLAYVKKLEGAITAAEEQLLAEVNETYIAGRQQYVDQINNIDAEIARLKGQRAEAESELLNIDGKIALKEKLTKEIDGNKSTLKALPSVKDIPDIEAIEKAISDIKAEQEANNKTVELHNLYVEAGKKSEEYQAKKKEADDLTAVINKLRNDIPAQISKDANIPIENLRFEDDKIFLGDMSLDRLSTSKKVEIVVKIVEAFNKGKLLKLICLDGAESLDDETLKEFEKQLPPEYQVFLSFVARDCQICGGSGTKADKPCKGCGGLGVVEPAGAFHVDKGKVKKQEESK